MNCFGGGGGGGQVMAPPSSSATAAAASSVFNIPGLSNFGDFNLLGSNNSKKKSEAIGKFVCFLFCFVFFMITVT